VVKYKNLDGRFENEIVSAVETALNNVNVITDQKLQDCIKKRLEKSGTIRIRRTPEEDNAKSDSDDCYKDRNLAGQHKSYGLGCHEIHSKEITLCVDNLAKMNRLGLLSDYILHEFAHSCGWHDGEDKGVPFPNGYPDKI